MEADFSMFPAAIMDQQAISSVLACNEETSRYGLTLSPAEARELVEFRTLTLQRFGRIEFSGGILTKMVSVFADSPFLHCENYAETIHELVEVFYYFKNESQDAISDDALIAFMKKHFDSECQGSVEFLQSMYLEKLAESIRFGENR